MFVVVSVGCIVLESVRHDGWYMWLSNRNQSLSWSSFWHTATSNYLHSNPRFGENVSLALYHDGVARVVVHALLLLASMWLLAVLGLGRTPTRRDGLVVATLVAMYIVVVPRAGAMMFYRPYFGNYVVGSMPGLALLAMFRCKLTTIKRWSWLLGLAVFVLGVLGGLGNEHTGPAFIALSAVGCWRRWRQGRLQPWMIAAVVGLVIGFAMLFLAPGQRERYAGIGNVSVLTTIASRSLWDSLVIVLRAPLTMVWLLPWMVLLLPTFRRPVLQCSQYPRLFMVALGFAVVIGGTLLGSPLAGPRLYFTSAAVLVAIAAPWICQEVGGRSRLVLLIGNALVMVVSCAGLLRTSLAENDVSEMRTNLLEQAAVGSVVTLPRVAPGVRQWGMGEDLQDQERLAFIARYFRLAAVKLEPR
jgi:Family of unknown function (DUF6056)